MAPDMELDQEKGGRDQGCGCFPVNSMQCNNAVWKDVLQHLLDAADVVVMDLSDLSEQNRGIAHELGKLVDEMPLRRVFFLVNTSTDLDVLEDILAEAWENIAEDSPNRDSVDQFLLFHLGGPAARMEEESVYAWKRRLRSRIDGDQVVGLLRDAPLPPRNPAAVDPERDKAAIRWSRAPVPRLARKVLKVAFGIYLFIILFAVLLLGTCSIIFEK